MTANQKRGWTLARDENAEARQIWRELTLLAVAVALVAAESLQ